MSTPINQIRRGGSSDNGFPDLNSSPMGSGMGMSMQSMQSNQPPMMIPQSSTASENQLVDDILKEINGNSGDNNISGGAFQYAMDQSQVPMAPPVHSIMSDQELMNNKILEEEYRDFAKTQNKLISKLIDTNAYPWVVSIINGLVVFLVLLFVSLPQTNKLIFTFLPGLLLESGQVSIQGVLLKCIIGMALYIIISACL
jgi:hypothetical protein